VKGSIHLIDSLTSIRMVSIAMMSCYYCIRLIKVFLVD